MRPPGFDAERHKKRNIVERAINKLKQFRAAATRYDKRCSICLGITTAAALFRACFRARWSSSLTYEPTPLSAIRSKPDSGPRPCRRVRG